MEEKTVDLIIDNIKDVKNDISEFKRDAHDKIEDVKSLFKDEINGIKNKISSIEQTNKSIEKHEFEIRQIKNDINKLANSSRKSSVELQSKIDGHCQSHKELIKSEINDTIKSLKAGFITKVIAWITAPATLLLIIGKLTGILDKIKIGIIK